MMTRLWRKLAFSVSAFPVLAGALLTAQTVSFFEGRTAYPAIGTVALATGDFNGDGVTDTLTAVPFAMELFPGRVKGTFGTAVTTKLPVSCVSNLLAVDFNKDGKLDFACIVSNSFQVALGNGDGTFGAPVSYSLSGLLGLVGADFNGDGVPDLASFTSSSIVIYLGKGDGTFLAGVTTVTTAGAFSSIHPANINTDGKADLVMTRNNTVAVFIGKGDGTFALPSITVLAKVATADSVTTGDLNGDGNLDIVVAVNKAAANTPVAHLAVLFQQAGGNFATTYFTTQNPLSGLELADVNGDGLLDVAGLRTYGSPAITILEGAAGGLLGAAVSYEAPAKYFNFANPRHQPVPDIIYTDLNTVALLPNQGNGAFVPGLQVQGGVSTSPCLSGDFNNDGQPDLACLDSYVITVTYGTGSRMQPFANPLSIQLIAPANSIALGDFNNDGKLDIVASLVDDTIQFVENEGTAGFVQAPQRSNAGSGLKVMASADFNQDGKLDLVTGGSNFLPGNGDGTFGTAVSFYSGTFAYFAVGDLNGDGKLDLIGVPGGEAPPVILLGQGTGQFAATVLTGVNGSYQPVIADLNSDGKPDVVIPAARFGVTILLNAGNGVFASAAPVFNDFWPATVSAAVGDFNGDGKPDIVFGIASSSVFAVTGNGDGTFGPTANGFSVEDSTSLLPVGLIGPKTTKPSISAGSSVITVLESQ